MQIIILLLLTVVALALIMLASIWQINKVTQIIIGKRHREIEYIVNTGKVPNAWAERFNRRISVLKEKTGTESRVLELKKTAKKFYLQKLDKLIEYAEKTTLVDSQETRRLLLERLNAVRKEWVETDEREL